MPDDDVVDAAQPQEVILRGKGQAARLGRQHELAGGPLGIFGEEAKRHDLSIREVSELILKSLQEIFPGLRFRIRENLSKRDINEKLSSIDSVLGEALFVGKSSIKPDGGIIQVEDKYGEWRIVLVGESKHQGNDLEKIKAGIKQGKEKDADLMVAGNAIERVHKNILEIRNYMIDELHFPYVVFLQGSNFATRTFYVDAPDGRKVKIAHDAGALNRIDRVTASSYGVEINKNYCRNLVVRTKNGSQMLQIASLFFQCESWDSEEMLRIMTDIANTSMDILSDDLVIS